MQPSLRLSLKLKKFESSAEDRHNPYYGYTVYNVIHLRYCIVFVKVLKALCP